MKSLLERTDSLVYTVAQQIDLMNTVGYIERENLHCPVCDTVLWLMPIDKETGWCNGCFELIPLKPIVEDLKNFIQKAFDKAEERWKQSESVT
jgi:hypothetical protein